MNGPGFPTGRAAALCVVMACALAACAPQRILLMPSPPTEIRKEPQPPPGDAGGPAPPPSPSPPAPAASPAAVMAEPVAAYAEAVDATTGALRRGRPEEAVRYWKTLEESRWGTDAVFNQGVLRQLAGDVDGAVEQYGRLATRQPVFEPAAANLLGIHLLRGDREKMTALLDRVLPPGSLKGWDALPGLQSNAAAALVETGRTKEAAAVLDSMASRGRRTPALAWTAAVIAYRRGDLDAARKHAAGLPPEIASLFPVFASRFALGEVPDSMQGLPAVPPGQPRLAELLANLSGFAEYRKGNPEGGEAALSPRKDGDLPFPEILSNIGVMQAAQGKWKEARANLERAVRGNPSIPGGWLNLGIFREVYEGNPEGARDCYEHYVKLNGLRSEEVRKWLDRLGQSAPRP